MFDELQLIPYETSDLRGKKVLIISPHPDDETLGCGGCICLHRMAGDSVKVVCLTNGAKGGTDGDIDKTAYVDLRYKELREACDRLGVDDLEYWNYEDRALFDSPEMIEKLVELLNTYRPGLVFAPSPMEIHPDHRASVTFFEEAVCRLNFDFEIAFYEIGYPMLINTLVDISDVMETKKRAMAAYASQLDERNYDVVAISMNRYRCLTLPKTVTYAEGLFMCNATEVRKTGGIGLISKKMHRYEIEKEFERSKSMMRHHEERTNQTPRISVILPTYNRREILKETIRSVLSQTYRNFELIVVNDGGADVRDIIDAFEGDGRIEYIVHPENLGVAAARNTGLKAARGEYIAYIDDDDIYYPDHLETVVRELEKGVYPVVYTGANALTREWITGRYVIVDETLGFNAEYDPEKLLVGNYIPTLNIAHRKELIDEMGLFDETMETHEDWDLWIRFSLKYEFSHIDRITTAFTRNQTESAEKRYDFYKTLKTIHARYAHRKKAPETVIAQKNLVKKFEKLARAALEESRIVCDDFIRNRYEFARSFVCRKTVLDISDGDGRGAFRLSESADSVVALSDDPAKIRKARTRYQKDNLTFRRRDDFPIPKDENELFDIVICFKAAESVDDVCKDIRQYLKTTGCGFVSGPIHNSRDNDRNLFEDFTRKLETVFPYVHIWTEKLYPSGVITPLGNDRPEDDIRINKNDSNREIFPETKDAEYQSVFAVVSSSPISPEMQKRVCRIDLSSRLFRFWKYRIDDQQTEYIEKELDLNRKIADKNAHIENLEKTIHEKTQFLASFTAQTDRHIQNLENVLKDKDVYLETRMRETENHIKNLEAVIREKEAWERHVLGAKENHIENLEKIIREKETHFVQVFQDTNAHIRNLEKIIRDKDDDIAGKAKTILALASSLDQKIAELENERQLMAELTAHQHRVIDSKEVHIRNIEAELDLMRSSFVWRWSDKCRHLFYVKFLGRFPLLQKAVYTLRWEGLSSFWEKTKAYLKKNKNIATLGMVESDYEAWVKAHSLTEEDIRRIHREIEGLKNKPKISILMPVYNVDGVWLEKAIESVIHQFYPNWELCIADDASPRKHIRKILEKHSERDKRIKVKYLEKNRGISGASNAALALATGEFIGLLDHDDELTPDALYTYVKLLNRHPEADLIYSDEDKIDNDGKRCDPFFKPDFSPDLLLSMNYICHFSLFRSELFKKIGGFRIGYEGSQDYDLILRYIEQTSPDKIFHVPHILYHWRKIPGSAAAVVDAKNYAFVAAKKALNDYLERNRIEGEVTDGIFTGSYRVKRRITGNGKVSIIIPFKDQSHYLKKCIDSILKKTDHSDYEIILVNNRSESDETYAYLKEIEAHPKIRRIDYHKEFNFSAINNYAVKRAEGRYVLLLNNDTEVITAEWLSAMVEHAQREDVGPVGAKLLYPDDTVQHAGVVMGIGIASHAFCRIHSNGNGYFGLPNVVRNYSAVTAACMMVRKSLYEELGGLDEEKLTVAYNDVDFCLRSIRKGFRVVYTPYALLYHYESISRGNDNEHDLKMKNPKKYERVMAERDYMAERWRDVIANDPYYNVNLTKTATDFGLTR